MVLVTFRSVSCVGPQRARFGNPIESNGRFELHAIQSPVWLAIGVHVKMSSLLENDSFIVYAEANCNMHI